ncbi:MAG: Bifunctional purine biosynthetic protein ade1 [Watsoniomyces obsoletus]|nr:MAG: Bifunctional purine biosynthetic protein ade1 [Watsoniomyces obsoletus]
MAPQVPWAVTPTNLDDHITYCEGLIQEVREDKRKLSPRFLLQVRGLKEELKDAQQDDTHDDNTDRFKRLTWMRGFFEHHVDAKDAAGQVLVGLLRLLNVQPRSTADGPTDQKFHAIAWNKNFWSWAEILKVVEKPNWTANLAASAEMKMQLQAPTFAEWNRVVHSEVKYFPASKQCPHLAVKIRMDAKTLPEKHEELVLHQFQTAIELARQ